MQVGGKALATLVLHLLADPLGWDIQETLQGGKQVAGSVGTAGQIPGAGDFSELGLVLGRCEG